MLLRILLPPLHCRPSKPSRRCLAQQTVSVCTDSLGLYPEVRFPHLESGPEAYRCYQTRRTLPVGVWLSTI